MVKKRLPDMLIEQGLVTREQLQECMVLQRRSGQSLPKILVSKGYLSEENLVVTLSEQLGIPHIRLAHYTIPKEVLAEVPEALARQHQMLPISVTGDVLTLAMADPLNIMALDDLRLLTSYDIEPVVAVTSELEEAVNRHYGGDRAEDLYDEIVAADDNREGMDFVKEAEDIEDVSKLEHGAEDEPVKKLTRLILFSALERGASDIHLEPFEKSVRLRYRVDGSLEESKGPPKHLQHNLVARLKILAGCRIDEHRMPQDGRFRIRYKAREIDFRVAFLPCKYGEKVVLRVLDKGSLALDLDGLGFEPQPLSAFKEAIKLPHGMILVTGPTGSGKTTTLYSVLHKLNTIDVNIVTVEDPIEYEMFGVNQVQTHAAIGLTFAEALRQILRQDPDIVMVGEIRDFDTADVAVKAALTGHLVLSTLHTNDAAGVFPRMTDMGIEPFLVQSSVALTSAQRLLKRVCPDCIEPITVPKEVLDRIQYHGFDYIDRPQFVRGRGCSKCKDSGYRGRVAVLEAMRNWPELQPLILNRASGYQIKQQAVACGMKTLRQNALARAAKGTTTIEQVLDHTVAD
ncbi:MAG TPA: ATPase, T2SS/T4P/T4SS family [Candidatus Hydrogenedentes bacterium]|nr:ATPase, T2SS/T4P/T4SS family [Candidatus Hydrogenedentota bacterium]HNT87374.1 ATPase, T2SS/T4P/T4SS family [Candidatus Hydrogenedentota bacterium]